MVKVIVEVLEPSKGRVYDPCCGSGGMFVQTEKFIYEHDGDPKDTSIYGQESNELTWRMAKMNLAIHGIDNKGLGARWGDTFARDQHADVQMDYVMANPPFNIKDWARNEEDPRWRFGVPPANNANYAWIQHILSKLTRGGKAGVVMANGSMSSNSNGEGDIRAQIVEADLVSCMREHVSAMGSVRLVTSFCLTRAPLGASPSLPWTRQISCARLRLRFGAHSNLMSWTNVS